MRHFLGNGAVLKALPTLHGTPIACVLLADDELGERMQQLGVADLVPRPDTS